MIRQSKRTKKMTPLMALLAMAGSLQAGFTPIPLTPNTFNQDIVVEKSAAGPIGRATTASVDGGTANTGATWYEQGYNAAEPTTGLPPAGSTFTSASQADHQYRMAPSYANANNAFLINSGNLNGTYTASFVNPARYAGLSFLTSGGGGGVSFRCIVRFQDGTSQTNTVNSSDWYNLTPFAFVANGRVNAQNFGFDTVNGNNPRLYSRGFALANTTSPVTSVDIQYAAGGGNTCIMAISGAASAGAPFAPIEITGYNADIVVEASAPQPGNLLGSTTATMDGGTNNTGNTWYEQGYDPLSASGLPAPGATLVSSDKPDHQYQMPASYSGLNAVMVDSNSPTAHLTLASPARYSGLSFLSATANGNVTNSCLMQYADGTSEVREFVSRDWFNNTPFAFTAKGRVDVGNKSLNNVGTSNPRLYEAEFALGNTTSPLTNIVLNWVGGRAESRIVVLAVSGTSGSVPPIIGEHPESIVTFEGSNVVFSVTLSGGTEPFSYQWQRGTNGVFANLVNGGRYSGVNTPQLSIADVVVDDAAEYRVVVSNGGSANSGIASLRVMSILPDITTPTDTVTGFGGNSPGGEPVAMSIDDSTTKYLNFGSGSGTFGGPVGLVVTPALGRTVVNGLRLYTANDDARRDPAEFVLEGSNDGGSHYTRIASGPLALPEGRNDAGNALDPVTQNVEQIMFANSAAYTTYRLSFPKIKDAGANMMQIGEVEFLGAAAPTSAPVFMTQPSSATAQDQSAASLYAYANGDPAPVYQWYKGLNGNFSALADSGNLYGAQSMNLVVNPVSYADAADYYVVASNSSGSTTSSVVRLTVISTGTDITLAGDGFVSYGGGSVGNPFSDAIGNYSNGGHGINAPAGFPPFGGPAGLIVTPSAGASIVNGLRVYTATDHPERDPVQVKIEGSTDGIRYATLATGSLSLPMDRNVAGDPIDPLRQSLQEVRFANSVPYTVYRITFADTRNPDTAQSVQVGQLELLGVTGIATPVVAPAYVNVSAGAGSTAQFDAVVTPADPSTTYQWKKLAGSSLVDVPGATGPSLVIPNPSASDAGVYVVVAANGAGSCASQPVVLNLVSTLADVTSPGDAVTGFNGVSPAAESAARALDNLTDKYLNFGNDNDELAPFAGPVGLVVTPVSGATVVTGLRVYAANDALERDPLDFTLEGSNGSGFSLVASGSLFLPSTRNAAGQPLDPLTLANQEVRFANATAYTTYRLSFSSLKDAGAANSLQIGEVELLGTSAPVGPKLAIAMGTDGSLTVSSPTPGTLQSTEALNGPETVWTDEGPVNGSITLQPAPGKPAKFYRLVVP